MRRRIVEEVEARTLEGIRRETSSWTTEELGAVVESTRIGGIERGSRAGRIAGWTRIEPLRRRFVLSFSFFFSRSLLKLSEPDTFLLFRVLCRGQGSQIQRTSRRERSESDFDREFIRCRCLLCWLEI